VLEYSVETDNARHSNRGSESTARLSSTSVKKKHSFFSVRELDGIWLYCSDGPISDREESSNQLEHRACTTLVVRAYEAG